ncbi:MAG: hypothetical protein E7291_10090 [Lachnospiraceae bacterium]|nr:hypothetical protein [Lachnospiraceae bacterium]
MNITFNPHGIQDTDKHYTEKHEIAKTHRDVGAYKVGFMPENNIWEQGVVSGKEKGKTLIELQQEAGNVNVAVQQDYMTLMSHTMSEEDYAKLSEEGFHFDNVDPETAVTIVDKIKAELARSGQHIAGYTDDLDMETLAAAVGSDTLARSISDCFAQADIPMTQENIDNVARAWEMVSQLQAPGEGASYYMIDNGLQPEIWNLYLAQSSGAQNVNNGAPRYYAEEIQGYFTQSAGRMADEGLQEQMDKIITEAGLEVNVESRQQAQWLMSKGLPLTAENMQQLDELQQLAFPVEEERFARAAAVAIAEGRNPIRANLTHTENIYEKAAALSERYYNDKLSLLDAGDITARRQLEEIRLRMTAEVNVKLLKSGFAIDTAPMEQFLEALKQAEAQVADSYFPGDGEAVGKYKIYKQTNQVVTEIPSLPLQLIGSLSIQEEQGNIAQFHAEGTALRATFDKAQESYESLMTSPRRDMGDSIRKAFANVDAILEDMSYELTEDNQRAVRILGYNRMSMTAENLEAVKAADAQVRFVIEKMTPAATLKMIRDGINPLEQSFAELEAYFNDLPEGYEESAESYSRFLYQLERHHEISSQERDAYIGIYRLLRQIEKSDGAVIGAVVNSQAELQFKNLLSAVRSNRFGHMDVKATDETGLTAELVRSENNISDQITNNIITAEEMQQARDVLTEVSDNDVVDKEYTRMLLEMSRQAAEVDAESVTLLQRGNIPASAGNLLAAQSLLSDRNAPFKKWKEKLEQIAESNVSETDSEDDKVTRVSENFVADTWEDLSDRNSFKTSYSEMLTDMSQQVEEISLNLSQSSLDVRELQMIHKQLSVMGTLADSEEYILPMYVGDELAKVHLTLEHGKAQKGEVAIEVDISEEMHVEAHLRLQGKKLSGFLVGNTGEEVTKLQEAADIFFELIQSSDFADWQMDRLPVVAGRGDVNPAAISGKGMEQQVTEAEVQQPTNTELYQIAKLFLQAIKK